MIKIEPDLFRRVLGHFPTGVVVVTAMGKDGNPVGMAVNAFTSVSLEPPLVAFFPAVSSKTWPEIESCGGFCINILSTRQEKVSRGFSRSGTDKFAGVPWYPSPGGMPALEDAVAWIDCDLFRVDEAGDHYAAYGRVKDMRLQEGSGPLVFFRGGYGGFEPVSLVAGDPRNDLGVPLRLVDLARPALEEFTERSNTQVAVTGLVGDELVVLAVAGAPAEDRASGTFVGVRVRAVPPIGGTIMAWEPHERVATWTALAPAEETENVLSRLEAIRRSGIAYSLEGGGIKDWQDAMSEAFEDRQSREKMLTKRTRELMVPQVDERDAARVRNVHVPVFDASGRVGLVLHVGGFEPLDNERLAEFVAEVKSLAGNISKLAAS
ncbi:flavin reductase [Pseudarthrobacter sp. fls2-241-R2A-168]|uniref:flavin reductase n=1 Tax=Pseudarthrobacter sp. fls2-241-R2A-168 TaxID=3040304 RepID=UPI002554C1B7|nr:flavin reductase [Pseudarthrobacter sp. fls2-241-R2A-168]